MVKNILKTSYATLYYELNTLRLQLQLIVWKKRHCATLWYCVGKYCINMDVTSYILRDEFLRNVAKQNINGRQRLKILVRSETGVTEFVSMDMK